MWYVVAAIAGYVAACFTWPWLRAKLQGPENEIMMLRQRIKDFEAKVRTL